MNRVPANVLRGEDVYGRAYGHWGVGFTAFVPGNASSMDCTQWTGFANNLPTTGSGEEYASSSKYSRVSTPLPGDTEVWRATSPTGEPVGYCDSPFSPHPEKAGLKHSDYWGIPGVEGSHISVVSRRIEIVEATYFFGDRTLYKTREERLVRVVTKLNQLFYIDDAGAKKAEKQIEITFYLSRHGTPNGEYLILNHSPVDYDIYFDDAIRSYLNKTKEQAFLNLKQSLIKAGMQGLAL
jgi:hypothetical protein